MSQRETKLRRRFRERPLDLEKPIPIYHTKEDLKEDELYGVEDVSESRETLQNVADEERHLFRVVETQRQIDLYTPICTEIEPVKLKTKFVPTEKYIEDNDIPYELQLNRVHYVADEFDDDWMDEYNGHKSEQKIDIDLFELLIDTFEKTTGTRKVLASLPEAVEKWPERLRDVPNYALVDVYEYWKQRRLSRMFSKPKDLYPPTCGKPLLEIFEIPPKLSDDDPHVCFRPRKDEKRRPTMSQKNGLLQLSQIMETFNKQKTMAALILEREYKSAKAEILRKENFRKRIHYLMDLQIDEEEEESRPSPSKKQKTVEDAYQSVDLLEWDRDREMEENKERERREKEREEIFRRKGYISNTLQTPHSRLGHVETGGGITDVDSIESVSELESEENEKLKAIATQKVEGNAEENSTIQKTSDPVENGKVEKSSSTSQTSVSQTQPQGQPEVHKDETNVTDGFAANGVENNETDLSEQNANLQKMISEKQIPLFMLVFEDEDGRKFRIGRGRQVIYLDEET